MTRRQKSLFRLGLTRHGLRLLLGWLLLTLVLSSNAWALQARNFAGGASTDVLTSTSTLQFDQFTSYFIRFKVTALDATTRRFFDWGDVNIFRVAVTSTVIDIIAGPDIWTGIGNWTATAPSAGTEHDLLITYDAGLTTNKPVVYLDGSSIAVTTVTAPTGSPVFTGARTVLIGNSGSSNRAFNGWDSTLGIWRDVLLSASDATSLHNGSAPCAISPANLAFYAPLEQGQSPEPELKVANNLTVTGTTVVTGSTVMGRARCVNNLMLLGVS